MRDNVALFKKAVKKKNTLAAAFQIGYTDLAFLPMYPHRGVAQPG
jgi:hypothetical protein